MIPLLVGLLLLPLSASLAWVSAKALAGVAVGGGTALPFAAGLGLWSAAWLAARAAPPDPIGPLGWAARGVRWLYVLGHELTHALAAWAGGASVYAIRVGEEGGHVDLSRSSPMVALAPYCVPLYAAMVTIAYRVLLWVKPDAGGEALFLFLMGVSLGFHLLLTWDALTEVRQPDLAAAGGAVFSWSVIALVNGVLVLSLLKVLFPESVAFGGALREAADLTAGFWTWSWRRGAPLAAAAWKKARR